MIGKTLSHCRIVEQIGAGGMGVVWLKMVAGRVRARTDVWLEEMGKRLRRLSASKQHHKMWTHRARGTEYFVVSLLTSFCRAVYCASSLTGDRGAGRSPKAN